MQHKHSYSMDRGLRERSREKYDSENMHEALNWTGTRKQIYESNTASTGSMPTAHNFRMISREREDHQLRQTIGIKYGVKSSKIDLSNEYSQQQRNSDWMRSQMQEGKLSQLTQEQNQARAEFERIPEHPRNMRQRRRREELEREIKHLESKIMTLRKSIAKTKTYS